MSKELQEKISIIGLWTFAIAWGTFSGLYHSHYKIENEKRLWTMD